MPRQVDDDRYRDLLPSLEGHFASLLARHLEAAGKTEWSYHQYLPFEALRADALERPPLSATAYLAVETALLTEVNLPWYTAGLSRGLESCPGRSRSSSASGPRRRIGTRLCSRATYCSRTAGITVAGRARERR